MNGSFNKSKPLNRDPLHHKRNKSNIQYLEKPNTKDNKKIHNFNFFKKKKRKAGKESEENKKQKLNRILKSIRFTLLKLIKEKNKVKLAKKSN